MLNAECCFCHVFCTFALELELVRITLVRSDKSQELTECLLQSQFFYQTLQLIDDWRENLPRDELPQPLGLNLLRVPQNHQQITWLNSQTKMVLIQV